MGETEAFGAVNYPAQGQVTPLRQWHDLNISSPF